MRGPHWAVPALCVAVLSGVCLPAAGDAPACTDLPSRTRRSASGAPLPWEGEFGETCATAACTGPQVVVDNTSDAAPSVVCCRCGGGSVGAVPTHILALSACSEVPPECTLPAVTPYAVVNASELCGTLAAIPTAEYVEVVPGSSVASFPDSYVLRVYDRVLGVVAVYNASCGSGCSAGPGVPLSVDCPAGKSSLPVAFFGVASGLFLVCLVVAVVYLISTRPAKGPSLDTPQGAAVGAKALLA